MKLLFTLVLILAGSAYSLDGTYSKTCSRDAIAAGTCSPHGLGSGCLTIETTYSTCIIENAVPSTCGTCVKQQLASLSLGNTCANVNGNLNVCQKVLLDCQCPPPCEVAALDYVTCKMARSSPSCFIECQDRTFPRTPQCFTKVEEGCNCGLYFRGDRKCLERQVRANDIDTTGSCELPIFTDQAVAFVDTVLDMYRSFCRVPP